MFLLRMFGSQCQNNCILIPKTIVFAWQNSELIETSLVHLWRVSGICLNNIWNSPEYLWNDPMNNFWIFSYKIRAIFKDHRKTQNLILNVPDTYMKNECLWKSLKHHLPEKTLKIGETNWTISKHLPKLFEHLWNKKEYIYIYIGTLSKSRFPAPL